MVCTVFPFIDTRPGPKMKLETVMSSNVSRQFLWSG